MSYEELDETRYPAIKVDEHFCLLTIDSKHLQTGNLPDGLLSYDICKSDTAAGHVFKVSKEPVPDLYRWGRLISKKELSFDETGTYTPAQVSALRTDDAFTIREFRDTPASDLAQTPADGMLYRSNFGLIPVYPVLDMYRNDDNLYFGLDYYDEEEQMYDHFGDVTVNIDPLPYLHSTIDTNNNGDKILNFLQRNGFGEPIGQCINSGFCRFPIFRFDAQALYAIDPQTFAAYAKVHGQGPNIATTRLTNKIDTATQRAAEPIDRTDVRENTRES